MIQIKHTEGLQNYHIKYNAAHGFSLGYNPIKYIFYIFTFNFKEHLQKVFF